MQVCACLVFSDILAPLVDDVLQGQSVPSDHALLLKPKRDVSCFRLSVQPSHLLALLNIEIVKGLVVAAKPVLDFVLAFFLVEPLEDGRVLVVVEFVLVEVVV